MDNRRQSSNTSAAQTGALKQDSSDISSSEGTAGQSELKVGNNDGWKQSERRRTKTRRKDQFRTKIVFLHRNEKKRRNCRALDSDCLSVTHTSDSRRVFMCSA